MNRALVGIAVALALAGYAGVRLFVTPRTDAWQLVAADADGSVLWAELAVANTGLLDDQLTTRLVVLPAGPGSIEHRAQWGPAVLDETGVASGADSLARTAEGWELRVGGEGLGARVRTKGGGDAECPPTPAQAAGMVEDRVDGLLLSGPSVLVRTHTEGHVEGTALYVLGADFAAAIDPTAACPAWVRAGDRAWSGAAAPFTVARSTALTLGAWTLTFRSAADPVVHDGWAHALLPERWTARAFGFRPPVTAIRRAVVRVDGPGVATLAPAVAIERR